MAAHDLGDLREFARAHHVHCEVEPEEVAEGGHAALAGVRLRLLAARDQSAVERDEDEVALTLRVRCEAPDHRRPGAGQDRCIAPVRERLAALGVGRD
jgi:hypothetical protein